jgi:glycosyltransferase involved in cell wall biosynthesis
MSEDPRLSIVVPFFNSGRTIGACIESLLAQENVGAPYEIIMVDNRSTDGSAAIAARYSRLKILSEPTLGAYTARNTGIREANAPLIAFTDADCVVASNWLRAIIDGMQESQTAILVGHCQYGTGSSLVLRMLGAYENAKADYVIGHCAPAYHFACCNNMAVRAAVFERHGLFKEWQRAADSELVHRLAAREPGLMLEYCPSMRITHLEFISARKRAQRLRLYSGTNARIATFRELGFWHRIGVLIHMLRHSHHRRIPTSARP